MTVVLSLMLVLLEPSFQVRLDEIGFFGDLKLYQIGENYFFVSRTEGGVALVDRSGRVIAKHQKPGRVLPRFHGNITSPTLVERWEESQTNTKHQHFHGKISLGFDSVFPFSIGTQAENL